MIQRIQSVFLFAATILLAVMIFVPLAVFSADGEEIKMMVFDLIYIGILISISALLTFSIIFMYKNRWLQLRLCFADLVLLVGSQIFAIVYCSRIESWFEEEFGTVLADIRLPIVFPAISLILVGLAIRGILKDQQLIKSLDRIR